MFYVGLRFTAFVNPWLLVNQFQTPKLYVHMSNGMFSQDEELQKI